MATFSLRPNNNNSRVNPNYIPPATRKPTRKPMRKLKRNAIKCKHCGDVIESTYGHDFKWCSCKMVAVDGGKGYTRRLFTNSLEDFEELSEWEDEADALSDD